MMNKKNIALFSLILFLSILFLFTSCNGFYEPDTDIPTITDIQIIGDSADSLKIEISWNAVENSGGYNIYRAPEGSAVYSYMGSTGSEQLTFIDADDDLELGSGYLYKVSAYGLWHTKESDKSSPSNLITYFLPPVWEQVLTISTGTPITVATVMASANLRYYAYADASGTLHIGRLLEEDDPDSDDDEDTVFTQQTMPGSVLDAAVDPADPDYALLYSGSNLYLAYADYVSGNADSKELSVVEITIETDEDDDDVLTWEASYLGERWFSDNPASSISLVATGFGNASTLHVGYIETAESAPNMLKIRTKLLGTSSDSWGDISFEIPFVVTHAELFSDSGNISAAYTDNADSLSMKSRIDDNTGGEIWDDFSDTLPAFAPLNGNFSIQPATGSLTVFALEAADSWHIQTTDDGIWTSKDADNGSAATLDTLTAPFSAATGTNSLYILGAKTADDRPEVLMYDQDLEKWFSYGDPHSEGTGAITSPQLHVSGNTFHTAWIADGKLQFFTGN